MRKNHSKIVCIKLVHLPHLYIWCTVTLTSNWYIMFENTPNSTRGLASTNHVRILAYELRRRFQITSLRTRLLRLSTPTPVVNISQINPPSHQYVLHALPISSSLKGSSLIFCDQYKLRLSKYIGTWPTSAPACSWLVIRKFAVHMLHVLLAAFTGDSELFWN